MAEELTCAQKFRLDLQRNWGQGDLYRDTPIRFLGYANEVGEAFRAWVPLNAVRLTYVIASGYVCCDAFDKSHAVYKVGITLLDTLCWQTLASVLLPGLTINRLCAASSWALRKGTKLAPASSKLLTTAIGLAAIPFIVRPIDTAVEVGMNRTLRTLYRTHAPAD